MTRHDVVVVGAGHNGLVCACYLARAGLSVLVLEAAPEPGGCIATVDMPDGGGRLELGAYEHGGLRASGVASDLELETRFGLRFHLRDEVVLSPCDDGSALAFHASLERTVEGLRAVVGREDAESYRRLAVWSAAAMRLLATTEGGPPPSLRELAALAEAALGEREGARLLQTLLASASNVVRATLRDERLQGTLCHWAAHSQQPPDDQGTAIGALMLAGGHGAPAARPVGGSRSTVDALVRCLEQAGGELRCGAPAERITLESGRACAVRASGEVVAAGRAVVSAIDARRTILGLVGEEALPARLAAEVRRIHVGRRNVAELKVDAVIDALPPRTGPPGFERSFMLAPNTSTDIERAFADIRLGRLAERPPLMIAFPSTLERGWAPDGGHVIWISTFVPWAPSEGGWTPSLLERAGDATWRVAERALGGAMRARMRRLTGPLDWVARTGNAHSNPNHVEMSVDQLLGLRPSPSLSRYRTPLPGLYLTGAGTHPGGGVTGMPGRNAAAEVLADLGRRTARRSAKRMRARLALVRDAARAANTLRRAL
jgi:beta-carotene ketolase (CrtO type)